MPARPGTGGGGAGGGGRRGVAHRVHRAGHRADGVRGGGRVVVGEPEPGKDGDPGYGGDDVPRLVHGLRLGGGRSGPDRSQLQTSCSRNNYTGCLPLTEPVPVTPRSASASCDTYRREHGYGGPPGPAGDRIESMRRGRSHCRDPAPGCPSPRRVTAPDVADRTGRAERRPCATCRGWVRRSRAAQNIRFWRAICPAPPGRLATPAGTGWACRRRAPRGATGRKDGHAIQAVGGLAVGAAVLHRGGRGGCLSAGVFLTRRPPLRPCR